MKLYLYDVECLTDVETNYPFEMYMVYVSTKNGWYPFKSYNYLSSAKIGILNYLEKFQFGRNIPQVKISLYDKPFGSIVKNYYFGLEELKK